MNWLKAMLLMVVLGAILYGVNCALNKTAPSDPPTNDGNWTGDTPTGSQPASGASGGGYQNLGGSSYGQPQTTQPYAAPAYGAGAYTPANASTSANPAPASYPSQTYGQAGGYSPPASSPNLPPPASPDQMAGGQSSASQPGASQPSVYSPATPTIVNSDAGHSSVPTTPVGLVTNNQPTPEQPSSPPSAAPAGATPPSAAPPFASVMDNVTETLREGHLAEGLQRLTLMYDDPHLNADQTRQLNELLGRLAGTVVYSRQHLLLPPYEIRPGDRLDTIAAEFQVTPELLAKINGIADPDHLPVGQKIKVIRGPFLAIVYLDRREVTLVVQQCYAGRFMLTGVGRDTATLTGNFKVDRKTFDTPSHPADATRQGLPPLHHWIDFTNDRHESFGFCGVSDPTAGDEPRGLMLSARDAGDLYDILSVGSSIVVR